MNQPKDNVLEQIAGASFVKASLPEALVATRSSEVIEAAARLLEIGCKEIWITNGRAEASLFYRDGVYKFSPKNRYPVDTTGCGDTLFATYCWARTIGLSLEVSARLAMRSAEQKAAVVGPLREPTFGLLPVTL